MGVVFNSNVATEFFVEQGTTKVIPTIQETASGIVVIGNGTPIWKGGADQTLTFTTTVLGKHSILMWGFESGR